MVVDGLQESIGSIINWGQFYFKIKHEESQSSSCYPWQRELVSGQISELFVLCTFYGKEKEGGGGGGGNSSKTTTVLLFVKIKTCRKVYLQLLSQSFLCFQSFKDME